MFSIQSSDTSHKEEIPENISNVSIYKCNVGRDMHVHVLHQHYTSHHHSNSKSLLPAQPQFLSMIQNKWTYMIASCISIAIFYKIQTHVISGMKACERAITWIYTKGKAFAHYLKTPPSFAVKVAKIERDI